MAALRGYRWSAVVLDAARRARLVAVRGKGSSLRTVFLSCDARTALADYIELGRPGDVDESSVALFLSARSVGSRQCGGRLSARAVNSVLARIGRLHDGEHTDASRHISPLRPHDLRHTFAFGLSEATGADGYELQRRLGHRSQRYIARYTNPPEDVAAGCVEDMWRRCGCERTATTAGRAARQPAGGGAAAAG